MNDVMCETTRELIPDFVGDRADSEHRRLVDGHVVTCAECRAELELARLLLSSRYEVPTDLADRIEQAVLFDRRAVRRPWWGLTAAAIAALALGIGVASRVATAPVVDVPGYAYEVEGELWLSDDGVIAGAPMLDGLSDEALNQLLDELSVGIAGGAA
jgi:predicted anti-sigma-YlaC factor YlaD